MEYGELTWNDVEPQEQVYIRKDDKIRMQELLNKEEVEDLTRDEMQELLDILNRKEETEGLTDEELEEGALLDDALNTDYEELAEFYNDIYGEVE